MKIIINILCNIKYYKLTLAKMRYKIILYIYIYNGLYYFYK